MAGRNVDDEKMMSLLDKIQNKLNASKKASFSKFLSTAIRPTATPMPAPKTSNSKVSSGASVTNNWLSSSRFLNPFQVKGKKRKGENVDFGCSKQARKVTNNDIASAYTNYYKKSLPGPSSSADTSDTERKTHLQTVDESRHTLDNVKPFSNTAYTSQYHEYDNIRSRGNGLPNMSPTEFCGTGTTWSRKPPYSQKWQRPDYKNEKSYNWNREKQSLKCQRPDLKNQKVCSYETETSSTSCLINCSSCREYTIPYLDEREMTEMSNYVAMDCEFVGVGPDKVDALGRCSIVDHRGVVLYDQFVKPAERVTDYRTPWSGLLPRHIHQGIPFVDAQEKIMAIIKDKVVVGHAVHNDFRVLRLRHPVLMVRDTSHCQQLRDMAGLPNVTTALRKLSSILLGRTIQKTEHCSVTDSRACLDLFRLVRTQWEPMLLAKLQRQAALSWSKDDHHAPTDTRIPYRSSNWSERSETDSWNPSAAAIKSESDSQPACDQEIKTEPVDESFSLLDSQGVVSQSADHRKGDLKQDVKHEPGIKSVDVKLELDTITISNASVVDSCHGVNIDTHH